jgi:uncharacterized repeat protein (TIGR01451 family)
VLLAELPAPAEQHRATRLGNAATRFAPPRTSPESLRTLFRDEKLRPDFAAVLRQYGWQGKIEDMFAAAATAEISDIKIPIGTTMPFMSSRAAGNAICLLNVLWAGDEPAPAYAFNFTSAGRRYRCVTPKACSNFFLEDLGPEPKSALAIDCSAPEKIIAGRTAQVCLNVRNNGNVSEPQTTVTLPVPAGTEVATATAAGVATGDSVTWRISDLAPGAVRQVCADLRTHQPGTLSFISTASSARVQPVSTSCKTLVVGISAILLEKADDPDPVGVGETTTYTVKITNQGTADMTNVGLVVTLAPELVPVSTSDGVIAGQTVTLPVVPKLATKAVVSYKIVAKGVKEGDGRTSFSLTSDMLDKPVNAEESTRVY